MILGEQIKLNREKLNLTQEQLGLKLNVTRQAVYKWESGKGYPDIQNLIRLSELFEISLDEMIKGDSYFQNNIKIKGVTRMLGNRNFLSALSYFSFFFAPIILPILIMIYGDGEMRNHGKRSLLSQMMPFVIFILLVGLYGINYYLSMHLELIPLASTMVIGTCMFLIAVLTIGIAIWNIKEGIKELYAVHN